MIDAFTLSNGRLIQEEVEGLPDLARRVEPVWVDLETPSSEEKAWLR